MTERVASIHFDSSNRSIFFDEDSRFELDVSGFGENVSRIAQTFSLTLDACLNKIQSIESGEVVNCSSVRSESENRAVDHYNLRHPEELVPGKSLGHSIAQWEDVRAAIDAIIRGETTSPCGRAYTDAVFNGIGGSFLGPLMLVVGMLGADYNLDPTCPFRLHFVSNTDPDGLANVLSRLTLETTVLVNMSKSGSTAETKGNLDTFNALLRSIGEPVGPHNIAITTPGSPFDEYARNNEFLHIFHMANETGGRTSVCSAIGMVPCAFAGLDFAEFLRGMSHMDTLTRGEDFYKNPAFVIASLIQTLTNRLGPKNMIVLGYSDFLKEFSHYLQQLYMESLGKQYTISGMQRPYGQTVFGGVGTGEQHAFMQQVQKGLRDCFVRFVSFRRRKTDFDNEKAGSLGRQLLAFVRGTQNALAENNVPFMNCVFEENSMFSWGMMVALEERIVTMLAVMNDVNAYDQPGVQDGKLAADAMNKLSKQTVSFIRETERGFQFTGSAIEFASHAFEGQSVNAMDVEAILTDITANLDIDGAYPDLKDQIRAQRMYRNGAFLFDIAKL